MSLSQTQTENVIDLQRYCETCSPNPEKIRICARCDRYYCCHFMSLLSFEYCQYCFHDVILEDSIIRRIEQTKSLSGKKTFTRVMRARHLVFKGADWMFAESRIVDMTDSQIEVWIEMHHALYSAMLNEREARKIAANRAALNKMHKNAASMKIPSRTPGLYTDGTPIEAGPSVVTTTTVKRTRTTIPGSNTIQNLLAGMIATWKAQGLGEDEIKAKLGALVAGGK